MQSEWAARLRAVPGDFRTAIAGVDDHTLRHRPAAGEWSAIEVVGHLVDKMGLWRERVERIASEEWPWLPGYDQDASVRNHAYQQSDPQALLNQLAERCERFAAIVERLPNTALEWQGVHEEQGPLTLRQCIEVPLESLPGHLAQLRAALAGTSDAR
jgi:hypothetical protein